MRRKVRQIWMVLSNRNAIVFADRMQLVAAFSEFNPAVTGRGNGWTCTYCGKQSPEQSTWEQMHWPHCLANLVLQWQSFLVASSGRSSGAEGKADA